MTHEEILREEAKLFAGHNGDYEMLELSQAILAGAAALALLRRLEFTQMEGSWIRCHRRGKGKWILPVMPWRPKAQ